MSAINPEIYYDDDSLHGDYQYTTLDDIINNFILMYVGDDKLINNVDRYGIIFHAKRGLQELTFDSLKEVRAIELDISDQLTMILPENYVSYVRVSWIDEGGNFRPMIYNNKTKIAKNYLQDNEYNILFDSEGFPLEGENNSYTEIGKEKESIINYSCSDSCTDGKRFGMDTSTANINGWFTIDKRLGTINFSSQIESKTVVLEYISDGLEYEDSVDIKVHKFAEESLYNYIRWNLLNNRIGVQEYVVRRTKKDFYNSRRIARARIQGLKYNELVQTIRGRDKWLK